MAVRLQKFIADAGVASRRAGERMILEGLVEVNGRVCRELGTKVDPERDEVRVKGTALKAKRKLYVALHKPHGYICSRSDPEKRPRVYDLLPPEWRNLFTVGRLDYLTEGLIFLTNDGEFALRLTHPRYGTRKKYVVTVEGRVEENLPALLAEGAVHTGELVKAAQARVISTSNSKSTIEVVLTEGKNREIHRLFETQGLVIKRLKRVQIGPAKLGELPSGRWRILTPPEVKSLLAPNAPPQSAGARRSNRK